MKNGRLQIFYKWYIKGEYHCEYCPFSWEERGLEDADAGCYFFNDLRDTCRLLPPIRFLVGWARRKRAIYYQNHEYDDFGDWYDKERQKEEAMKTLLVKYFPDDKARIAVAKGISYEAEDIFVPVKYKPLRTRWKELVKDTWDAFLMIFIPYIRR